MYKVQFNTEQDILERFYYLNKDALIKDFETKKRIRYIGRLKAVYKKEFSKYVEQSLREKQEVQDVLGALEYIKNRLPNSFENLENLISKVNEVALSFANKCDEKQLRICLNPDISSPVLIISYKIEGLYVDLALIQRTAQSLFSSSEA